MRLLLLILLIVLTNSTCAEINRNAIIWVCSEKIVVKVLNGVLNSDDEWVVSTPDINLLVSFDYVNVESIFIVPIKNNEAKNNCDYKNMSFGQRNHITFYTPFNDKKISTLINRNVNQVKVSGVSGYLIIVRQRNKGKLTNYFSKFSLKEDMKQY